MQTICPNILADQAQDQTPGYQDNPKSLVLQQDSACCHATKTAQDQPEERDKDLKSDWAARCVPTGGPVV